MTNEETAETIESLSRIAEDFARVTNSLRAVTVRNEVRGFYHHLTTGIEVPDGDGGMRTLDPDTDRDVVIPGTRFTLGEVLDWSFSLSRLMEFVEADPGQQFESPGVIRRMFGFVSPSSTV
ncbi:MAG TPA: hypothetical protein VK054_10420 [Beutenbergiaceae bacterium]|nr:hypothetical protein [Beutenbergiaceae bacterium]